LRKGEPPWPMPEMWHSSECWHFPSWYQSKAVNVTSKEDRCFFWFSFNEVERQDNPAMCRGRLPAAP
jgi:hypothetical protein